MKKYILFCLLLIINFRLIAQVQTSTFFPTKDSYVANLAPGVNFGVNTIMYVSGGAISRIFTQFDIPPTTIPPNAIITSATLYLKTTGSHSSTLPTLLLESVLPYTPPWTETGITYSNAPPVNTSSYSTIPPLLDINNYMTADVKNQVQQMVNHPNLNFGWRIRSQTETSSNYVYFYSKDYISSPPSLGDILKRPRLVVTYVLPIKITAQEIHASSLTSTDGEIHPIITEGDGTYTYNWIDGATGNSIGTSQNLTGVGYGWYGLEVTDGLGNKGYMSFIVGAKCETVEIDYNPGPNYINDAQATNQSIYVIYTTMPADMNYGSTNYFSAAKGKSSLFPPYYYYWNVKSLLKFNLWLSDEFKIASSDLMLYAYGHNPGSGLNTDASNLDLVTEDWQENVVTYNSFPMTSTTIEKNIPTTTSLYQNETVDMKEFFRYWQINPTDNFGVALDLVEPTANVYRAMQFYSSDYTTDVTKIPKVHFKLTIECQYALLNTSPNGAYYTFKGDDFYVKYNEEYFDVDAELNYEIIDKDNLPVTLSQTITNVYGDNRIGFNVSSLVDGYYTLVVTNDKKEKWYLRFKKGI